MGVGLQACEYLARDAVAPQVQDFLVRSHARGPSGGASQSPPSFCASIGGTSLLRTTHDHTNTPMLPQTVNVYHHSLHCFSSSTNPHKTYQFFGSSTAPTAYQPKHSRKIGAKGTTRMVRRRRLQQSAHGLLSGVSTRSAGQTTLGDRRKANWKGTVTMKLTRTQQLQLKGLVVIKSSDSQVFWHDRNRTSPGGRQRDLDQQVIPPAFTESDLIVFGAQRF